MSVRLSLLGLIMFACFFAMGADAQESISVVPAAGPLSPVKAGDKISFQRRKYSQADATADFVLEPEPTNLSWVLDFRNEEGFGLKYKAGQMDLYGKDWAFIGTISKDGEKKLIEPERVLHWMPRGELKPGMEWKVSNDWVTNSGQRDCIQSEVFKAVAKPAYRDVKIAGVLTRVNVFEISIEGLRSGRSSRSACGGNGWTTSKTIVYSKDLDLILELGSIERDDFKKIRGGGNRIDTVTAIN